MDRWKGKVALVTGASTGIGAATVTKLVQNGMKVVGCARNFQSLESLAKKLNEQGPGEMWPVQCDMKIEADILNMFAKVEKKYGILHVLINNAGNALNAPLLTGSTEDWNSMWSLNVMAVCISSREAVKLMDKYGVNDGHIINMNSVSGHIVYSFSETHFYEVTKHALTAMTEGLRQELIQRKSLIRVTAISPGLVKTEFQSRLFHDDPVKAGSMTSFFPAILAADDIADEIVFVLSAPPRVNICELTVRSVYQGP